MSRPAGDAEQRLINAGKAILEDTGLSGMSVRAVAARAGVNIGLVSYHFGGKEAFVHRVVLEVYEEFFKDFSLEVEGEKDAWAALRKGLLRLARFVRDRRKLIQSLLKDLGSGEADVKSFVMTNFPRHGVIIAGLVRRCQAEGRIVDLPMPVAMSTLMAVVAVPTLMAESMSRAKISGHNMPSRKVFEESLLSDAALEQRVGLAMKALKA